MPRSLSPHRPKQPPCGLRGQPGDRGDASVRNYKFANREKVPGDRKQTGRRAEKGRRLQTRLPTRKEDDDGPCRFPE